MEQKPKIQVREGDYASSLYSSIESLEQHNAKIIATLGENVQNIAALFAGMSELTSSSLALAKLATDQLSLHETKAKEESLVRHGFKENNTSPKVRVADLSKDRAAQLKAMREQLVGDTYPSRNPLLAVEVEGLAPEVPSTQEFSNEDLAAYRRIVEKNKADSEGNTNVTQNEALEVSSGLREITESGSVNNVKQPIVSYKEIILSLVKDQFDLAKLNNTRHKRSTNTVRFFNIEGSVFTILKDLKALLQETESNCGVYFFDSKNQISDSEGTTGAVIWNKVNEVITCLAIPDISDLNDEMQLIDMNFLRPLRPMEINIIDVTDWLGTVAKTVSE